MNNEVILFYFYFSTGVMFDSFMQLGLTGEVDNKAGVPGTRSGVHRFASNSWMTVATPPYAL